VARYIVIPPETPAQSEVMIPEPVMAKPSAAESRMAEPEMARAAEAEEVMAAEEPVIEEAVVPVPEEVVEIVMSPEAMAAEIMMEPMPSPMVVMVTFAHLGGARRAGDGEQQGQDKQHVCGLHYAPLSLWVLIR
jgi:hypothetical protein